MKPPDEVQGFKHRTAECEPGVWAPPARRTIPISFCMAWWHSSRCDEYRPVQRRNDFARVARVWFRTLYGPGCRTATTVTSK